VSAGVESPGSVITGDAVGASEFFVASFDDQVAALLTEIIATGDVIFQFVIA
jgi:hypothetical protein